MTLNIKSQSVCKCTYLLYPPYTHYSHYSHKNLFILNLQACWMVIWHMPGSLAPDCKALKFSSQVNLKSNRKHRSSSALSGDRDRFFFFLSSEHNRYAQTHVCAQMHFCLHAVHIQSQTWQHILTDMLMFLFLLKDNKTFVAQVAKRHYSKCTSK